MTLCEMLHHSVKACSSSIFTSSRGRKKWWTVDSQKQDAVTDCFTTYGNHMGVLQMAMYMSVTNSLEKNSEGVADEQ